MDLIHTWSALVQHSCVSWPCVHLSLHCHSLGMVGAVGSGSCTVADVLLSCSLAVRLIFKSLFILFFNRQVLAPVTSSAEGQLHRTDSFIKVIIAC